MFGERMGWSPLLVGQGGRMALASGFFGLLLSPVLVRTRPHGGLRVAAMVVAGLISLAVLSVAIERYSGFAQVVALYGLRLDLPITAGVEGKAYAAMVVAAYVSVAMAVAGCLTGNAASRLLGYGLLLLATSGHQIVATNQTLFSLCGLCARALGAVRLEDTAVPSVALSPAAR
jgi:hypothetical protein